MHGEGLTAPVVFFTSYLIHAEEYGVVVGVLQNPFTTDQLMGSFRRTVDG